ncbi:glycerophosphodiester phosphodiesterase [Nonomuraea fuscirosea]|uniref:glycerophosphodiester phosphodiesterase n=1 Tax=Nonomuraea fuscirosea TaxID=1291556 RepID=UPI0033C459E3
MYRSLGVATAVTLILTATPALAAPRDDLADRVGRAAHPAAPRVAHRAAHRVAHRVDNIAHRGGAAHAPENTIAACALARAQRADVCEFDVQQTKDGRLVLMHDETLERTTNVEKVFPGRAPWRVADFTLAEIRRLDAGSWFSPRYRGEGVPTLTQALQSVRGTATRLLVEVKHPPYRPDIDRRVAAELQEARELWSGERLTVQAFGWQSMRVLRDMVPGLPIALLGKPAADRLTELARYADGLTVPHAGLTAAYVRKAHKRGMRVYTWSADRSPLIRRLVSYGVDGIMTNRPDRLHEVTGPRPARSASRR